MLSRRRISLDVAEELGIRALTRGLRDWIVFVYFGEDGCPAYCKLRPAIGGEKRFYRTPRGVQSLLYNLPSLDALNDEEAPIVVEGELDVAALLEAGERGVVSVPDGAGSQLRPGLLRPLRRFAGVILGVDNDDAGDDLATRMSQSLGVARCRRIDWSEGGGYAR